MTRFKEMEEGETGYPMAREDRETPLSRERGRRARRAGEVVGVPRRPCLHRAQRGEWGERREGVEWAAWRRARARRTLGTPT